MAAGDPGRRTWRVQGQPGGLPTAGHTRGLGLLSGPCVARNGQLPHDSTHAACATCMYVHVTCTWRASSCAMRSPSAPLLAHTHKHDVLHSCAAPPNPLRLWARARRLPAACRPAGTRTTSSLHRTHSRSPGAAGRSWAPMGPLPLAALLLMLLLAGGRGAAASAAACGQTCASVREGLTCSVHTSEDGSATVVTVARPAASASGSPPIALSWACCVSRGRTHMGRERPAVSAQGNGVEAGSARGWTLGPWDKRRGGSRQGKAGGRLH